MRRDLGIIAGATVVAATIVATTQTGLLDRQPADTVAPAAMSGAVGPADPEAAPAEAVPAPELEAAIADLAALVAAREAELDGLRQALAERDAEAAEPLPSDPAVDSEIAALGAQVTAREAELAELRAALADRDAELRDAQAASDQQPSDPAQEALIAELTGQVAAREAELAELRTMLAERDAGLRAAEAELGSLRTELAALKTELASLRERYAFEQQLAAVKAGTAADDEPPVGPGEVPEPVVATVQVAIEAPMTAIHFETGSARLTPGGQAHAAAAAVMLGDMPLARIRIDGFADRTGSRDINQALARARAQSVADFLIGAGLPADRIEISGRIDPESLPVTTAAGVSEPLNRSATITPVPPPTT